MSRFSGVIYLKDAVSIMNRVDVNGEGIPFDCEVRTFNRYKKTGGALKAYKGASLLPLSSGVDKKERFASLHTLAHVPPAAKNPNHFDNRTRNIKLHNGLTRKINLNFLIAVNGQQVAY